MSVSSFGELSCGKADAMQRLQCAVSGLPRQEYSLWSMCDPPLCPGRHSTGGEIFGDVESYAGARELTEVLVLVSLPNLYGMRTGCVRHAEPSMLCVDARVRESLGTFSCPSHSPTHPGAFDTQSHRPTMVRADVMQTRGCAGFPSALAAACCAVYRGDARASSRAQRRTTGECSGIPAGVSW